MHHAQSVHEALLVFGQIVVSSVRIEELGLSAAVRRQAGRPQRGCEAGDGLMVMAIHVPKERGREERRVFGAFFFVSCHFL